MASEYEIEQAIRQITIARFLLTRADNRGWTHGEKHHVIKVVLWLLMDAEFKMGDKLGYRNEVETLDASDIPF